MVAEAEAEGEAAPPVRCQKPRRWWIWAEGGRCRTGVTCRLRCVRAIEKQSVCSWLRATPTLLQLAAAVAEQQCQAQTAGTQSMMTALMMATIRQQRQAEGG